MARNSLFIGALALAVVGMAGEARAQQTCTAWPVTLTSGATANAIDVMNDLNCAATYGLAISNQNVGIGLTSPAAKLDVAGGIVSRASPNTAAFSWLGDIPGAHWTTSMGSYDLTFLNDSATGALVAGSGSLSFNGETFYPKVVLTQGGGALFGGNVGIGNASPYSPLTVNSVNTSYSSAIAIDTPTTGEQAAIQFTSHGSGKWQLGKNTDDAFFLYDGVRGQSDIYINSNGNMQLMPTGGSVGVGGYTSTSTFYVNGTTVLTQGYSTTSDGRLKKDITPITGALGLVEQLRGVRYDWRPVSERAVGKTLKLPLDTPQIGFIAQEVQAVVPEAVVAPKPGSDEVYSLKEEKLIPLLVEAIKEQQAQIAKLEAKVARLEASSASAPASK